MPFGMPRNSPNMKTSVRWLIAFTAGSAILAAVAASQDRNRPLDAAERPELAYLKAVNRTGPHRDPEPLFILMGQYLNANRAGEGAQFVSALLKELEPRLSDHDKSLYLAAIGLLRAQHAGEVSLLKRIGWVNETINTLEEAKRLSGGSTFPVRWVSGVVYAQLPGFFKKREAAWADLQWCVENTARAPHAGWLREIYYQLGDLHRQDGRNDEAQRYLQLSGYRAFGKQITLTTPFAKEAATGHTFSPQRIAEIVPGKVYLLSGFEFTEYYFVVSEDRRELIAIDAGTRPDSAKTAYEALRAYAPGLPALTTVLVTHAHWDHIGGHRFFGSLTPRPRFYARGNYHGELARSLAAPGVFGEHFFGTRFQLDDLRDFKPDVTVDGRTEIKIGGTRIEFVPIHGGETDDGLFINLPDQGVMFVGDFIMPYLGAPFVEEGNLDGLLDAIDVVAQKRPRHLLHGHEPLTRLFASPAMLMNLKSHLAWLRGEVLAAIQRGEERAALHYANLIPPGLLGDSESHLPYLVMRENVINRLYDQHVGYWQPDLQGVDHLSRADRGALLVDYLGVSERQLVGAAQRMIADGKYELAATALDWTRDRFPESAAVGELERLVYLKLAEKYQEFNPFKFIVYLGKSGLQAPQMAIRKPESPSGSLPGGR
jgi:glyoxylase-like metal-dependent hydrolase (beta-lactamase superfamily II)